MNKKMVLFFCMFGIQLSAFDIIDFDSSMEIAHNKRVATHKPSIQTLAFFKKLYELNNPYAITSNITRNAVAKKEKLKIPKLIHQVWLGEKLPEKFAAFRQSWIAHHPDWTFIFWTDNPINYDQGQLIINSFEELDFFLDNKILFPHQVVVNVNSIIFNNRSFYDQAVNYGEKSDILKWEIVYRVGGLYVDTDYECLRPHDEFHYMYDLYTGIQPLDTGCVQLGAALHGASSGHPILKACVEGIKDNQHIKSTVAKTGPIHFTTCFLKHAYDNNTINIALPASYFYPCSYAQKGMPASAWQCPESYAVHHWAGSWLPGRNRKTQKDSQYYSQFHQDQFINEYIFKNKKNGIFIEVGAYDGITYSNTYFFEKHLNWTGICIEPIPYVFEQLQKNRTAICYCVCAAEKNGKVDFLHRDSSRFKTEMLSGIVDHFDQAHLDRLKKLLERRGESLKIAILPARTLTSCLLENNIYDVDLLSIDVEGGEKNVLLGLDFNLIKVKCMIVENNVKERFKDIHDMLTAHGYLHFARAPFDEIYVLPELVQDYQISDLPIQMPKFNRQPRKPILVAQT